MYPALAPGSAASSAAAGEADAPIGGAPRFRLPARVCPPFLGACLVLLASAARADISVDGDRLTIKSSQVSVSFRGPDLVRLGNQLTGEQYVATATPLRSMLEMGMLEPTGRPLQWTEWRRGNRPSGPQDAAMMSLNDLTRSVWLVVTLDPQTQDVVVTLWGEANREGVTGLTWGIRGLDLSAGHLVLPVQGGRYADRDTAPASMTFDYPTQWEAQMLVWETAKGGCVVYSRDDVPYFKKLHIKRRGGYADLGFETEAPGPFAKAGGVPQVEWRINAFRGDWRVPAEGYRNLMHYFRSPVPSTGARAWARTIRTVATIHGSTYDPKLLDALAARLDPKKTLLYLPEWRRDGYDVNYPDYTPGDSVEPFVERAHALGFHVMLHTDLPGVSPRNPDYARVQRFQVKDPTTGAPLGWYWDHPEDDPSRFAFIDPAARPYRDLFIARVREMVEDVHPDALHLDVSGPMWNDGGGLIDGKNYAQGSMALHRALLAAFPNLVLGGESMNEVISPYNWFAQRWSDGELPPHPISDFLFGDHVLSYGYLGQPNPDQAPDGFLTYWRLYEGQGVAPTPVLTTAADLGDDRAGMQRVLKAAHAWQTHDLQPDWSAPWGTARYRWKGADGVDVAIELAGSTVRMREGDRTLYTREHGANTLVTSAYIPGWPAWDDSSLYGLDPQRDYWLDQAPRPTGAPHISFLSSGTLLDAAQVTDRFALFHLGVVTDPASDLVRDLPHARSGTIVGEREGALDKGATAEARDVTSGGLTRRSLFVHPPWQDGTIGETFVDYDVMVPDSHDAALVAWAGLDDDAAKSDGVTFTVQVEGSTAWHEDVLPGAWKPVKVDLSRYAGKLIKMRLLTGPGPKHEPSFDHAAWGDPHIAGAPVPPDARTVVALPAGAQLASLGGAAEGAAVHDGKLEIAKLQLPTSLLVCLQEGDAVQPGQSLLDVRHDGALAGDGLARPGSAYGSGGIGPATCGGVKKERALSAHTPDHGQTIFSWLLRVPANASALGFAAGLADGARTNGVGFSVRLDGETMWSAATREPGWHDGKVDLARWRGKTVLVQLVADAEGDNLYDWAYWSDLSLQ